MEFNDQHPRGQPTNPGQFKEKPTARPDAAAVEELRAQVRRTTVKSTRWATLPSDLEGRVTLGEGRTPSYNLGGDCRAYDVYVDDTKVGTVESKRTESWRKSGRIRTSMRGRPKTWDAKPTHDWRPDGHRQFMPVSSGESRTEAVVGLVTRWKEKMGGGSS